jgi:membrane-bound lytic murein transglycosylase F
MQLMPVTMDKYGIDYDSSVEEQLEAGGKLLLHFDQNLPASISDTLEREKFMLACYNAGMGHVLESRLAAEKHGKDRNLWTDNVEFFGPKQTYYFVKEVTKRYSHYKALIE